MRVTSDRLMRRYPLDAVWVTVRSLFRQYPQSDVSTRISIINRAEELLEPYWEVAGLLDKKAESSVEDDSQGERAERSAAPEARSLERSIRGGAGSGAAAAEARAVATGANVPAKSSTPPLKSSSNRNKEGPTMSDAAIKAGYDKCAPGLVPVQYVKGVGPKLAGLLGTLEIKTVEDLLRHYPRRHLDFQNRLLIKDLKMGEEVTIFGSIALSVLFSPSAATCLSCRRLFLTAPQYPRRALRRWQVQQISARPLQGSMAKRSPGPRFRCGRTR